LLSPSAFLLEAIFFLYCAIYGFIVTTKAKLKDSMI